MPTWCKGSHEGLKIPWTAMSVPVRVRPSVLKLKNGKGKKVLPILRHNQWLELFS